MPRRLQATQKNTIKSMAVVLVADVALIWVAVGSKHWTDISDDHSEVCSKHDLTDSAYPQGPQFRSYDELSASDCSNARSHGAARPNVLTGPQSPGTLKNMKFMLENLRECIRSIIISRA